MTSPTDAVPVGDTDAPGAASRPQGPTSRSANADLEASAPSVSVVIPCRNEEATIGDCVRRARSALEAAGYRGEVVVAENGSSDASPRRAREAGARVVEQRIRGYGAACLTGLSEAKGDFLVLVDGDGTYDPSALHRLVEPLRVGYDLVVGTRRNGELLEGSMRRRHRHLLEPVVNRISRHLFRFRVSDVRCGFRAVRREALERMELEATGMEFASEMLVEASRRGLRVMEVPVRFHPRHGDESRRSVGDGWRVARQALLLSPTRLFLLPGLLLLLSGLALEGTLVAGPIRFPWFNLDFHFMFVGALLAILGLQLVLLGLYARTHALVEGTGPPDPLIERFHLHYTLERGVVTGGLLFGAGLSVNVWILASWVQEGMGVLFAVRPATLALTLMVIGAEVIFASFFMSVLRASHFHRV